MLLVGAQLGPEHGGADEVGQLPRDRAHEGEGIAEILQTADVIPLVYDSMALTWAELNSLKATIRAECSAINREPFRTRPEDHTVCFR